MRELRRGMVVTVKFNPVKGSETGKERPWVIVTNDVYNARVPVIQVVPITEWSAKKAAILTNVAIEASPENGLRRTSVADCLQTRPIDRRHKLSGILGTLDSETMKSIDKALRLVFELS
ncbi:MAG: type II toxin-antitoxin system PemK/MazF family toxin [Bacteroidia bacterium]|nr:type II toxin-antitoxin system PemK/MazF family toxin [Bacteroidia bacterium]